MDQSLTNVDMHQEVMEALKGIIHVFSMDHCICRSITCQISVSVVLFFSLHAEIPTLVKCVKDLITTCHRH